MAENDVHMPEEGEFVLCTVTAIQYHSVFCTLDEYGGRTGMIHISEIAPGRIRNIRDYVQVGKKVVCKILRIDRQKGHIDLSLRRVNESQRRQKLNQIKQEQLAEKIVEYAAKQRKEDPAQLYDCVLEKIPEKYDSLFAAFEAVAFGNDALEKFGIETKLAKDLTDVICARIKPPEVFVEGDIILSSYAPDGVERIKAALKEAEKVQDNPLTLKYKGAGMYHVRIKSEDYKSAEKTLKKAVDNCIAYARKHGLQADFRRVEAD